MTPAGYASTREHLLDELRRIDQLVRAQVLRWRLTLADTKPEQLWGMAHVTDHEVQAFMEAPFLPFDEVPEELAARLGPYWAQASAMGDQIALRLEKTEPGVSRLSRVSRRFSISALEHDILLVALLPALDERYRRLFGYLQDDCSRSAAPVGLVEQILQGTARSAAVRAALGVEATLRVHRMVELEPDPTRPLAMRAVRVDDRIAAFLSEQDGGDERLSGIVRVDTAADPNAASPAAWSSLEPVLDWLAHRRSADPSPICLVEGPPGGRLAAARLLCRAAGARMLVADVAAAMRSELGWGEIVDRVYREAALSDAWVVWRGLDDLPSDAERRVLLAAARSALEGGVLISADPLGDGALLHGRSVIRLEAPRIGSAEREQIWVSTLTGARHLPTDGDGVRDLAQRLTGLYRLSPDQIRAAVVAAGAAALARDPAAPAVTAEDLAAGCRAQAAVRTAGIAERIEPRPELTLETLIVPPAIRSQIDELGRRITSRDAVSAAVGVGAARAGRGVTAMFAGPSGCGKTLAAEALASELGVDLYRIDLSAVVSKYVGETEKNLARVFAEIEDSNGILFFDEADALFGKRGEVVDARDRWANTEVNYLLQTLERYEGAVILATNLRQNIDSAFTRRIQVVVEFPFPDADGRLALWRAALGRLSRLSEEHLQSAADRFQLTGGSIANAALDAVFRAVTASESGPADVTLAHLAAGIAGEYRRLGKPITRGEFGGELYDLATAREPAVARG